MTGIFDAPKYGSRVKASIGGREARDEVFVTALSTGLSLDLMIDRLLQDIAEKWI